MSTSPELGTSLYQTTEELVSESAFRVVLWFGVGLCTTACGIRFGIRFACFRRLLIEDYLMLLALLILIAIASVLQRYVGDIYYMIHVQNQIQLPGPDFEQSLLAGLRADGIVLVTGAIGIYTIKLNFLFFFYRLGHQIKAYRIAWRIALFIILGSAAVNLGVIPYSCSFGNIIQITVDCATESSVSHTYTVYKLTVALDVICDAIIVGFPVAITWRTKMTLRQKFVLTSVFLLVGFTIAVTVVRGSIFGGVYKDVQKADRKVFDTAWVLFWLFIEYIVSLLIACVISFRSLWVNRKQKEKNQLIEIEKQRRIIMARRAAKPPRSKWQIFHRSVLDTLAELEGTTLERDSSMMIQLEPPSGTMTVDFSRWGNDDDAGIGTKSTVSSSRYEGPPKTHNDSSEQLTKVETSTLNQSESSSEARN
ncbi:hypothetical protein F5B20DRAFT_579738 [Whalleya microplaca]|nr:hypothetical protein F5B20DRAFT_579738 [Whalleya microplaca]